MNTKSRFFTLALASISLAACTPTKPPALPEAPANTKVELTATGEPTEITVQHCLFSFAGSPVKEARITRTQEEAKELANDLMKMVQSGDDFDEIVQQFTNDSAPGNYSMSNIDVKPSSAGVTPRNNMAPAFGDIGFKLGVGEYGLAEYDPQKSPYGWHIIKRIK